MFSFCDVGCRLGIGRSGGACWRGWIFLVAGDEPDVRVEVLARTVRLEFQITHADHRGARAELVKEIHELLVGGDHIDVLHLFDKKCVVRVHYRARVIGPANSAGFGLRLNRTHEIDGLVFGRDKFPLAFHAWATVAW